MRHCAVKWFAHVIYICSWVGISGCLEPFNCRLQLALLGIVDKVHLQPVYSYKFTDKVLKICEVLHRQHIQTTIRTRARSHTMGNLDSLVLQLNVIRSRAVHKPNIDQV